LPRMNALTPSVQVRSHINSSALMRFLALQCWKTPLRTMSSTIISADSAINTEQRP
jgi:hypothetical protein